MADSDDRVRIELVDAGDHKDRVVMVLSKVKGLTMSPQQLVQHVPCTVATDVPANVAETLKDYLQKAGAMVMLERDQEEEEEEELFSADEFSMDEAPDIGEAGFGADEADDLLEFEAVPGPDMGDVPDFEEEDDLIFTTDEMATPSESAEDNEDDAESVSDAEAEPVPPPKGNVFQKLLASFPAIGGKKNLPESSAEDTGIPPVDHETDEVPPKKSPLAFLEKFRKPRPGRETPEDETSAEITEISKSFGKKTPDFLSSPVAYVLVGIVAGGLIMGTWGWRGIQKQRQKLEDYEIQTAQQIEDHSAALKEQVAQLSQYTEQLQQDNAALTTELEEVKKRPSSIAPTDSPLEMMPWEEHMMRTFHAVMERDAQILEDSIAAQTEAGCSQQVLLDGNGTLTYAQVIKQFSALYTRYDIRRSDSLITPYVAELKIPFKQEMKTGATQGACDSATLQALPTPEHHEFGGYYGYWTLEYYYQNDEWHLNTTVFERNRALYESAFQKGSPDYAKFKIDPKIFPELSN